MRAVFQQLRLAAGGDVSVLIEGETGTGKDLAAESVHRASARKNGPFVVIDCGALPPQLIESELFGHEKGAFTGAFASRIGAFEAADRGTVFLDEVGELPLELQPRLLRVIEKRTVRRVGASAERTVDFRLLAATHRDLRGAVNAGTFREDLYYRIAVMRVRMPAMRERPEDFPPLVKAIADRLGTTPEELAHVATPEFYAHLARGAWPGNVRELRNYLEACLLTRELAPLGMVRDESEPAAVVDFDRYPSYETARSAAIERFERTYVAWLLHKHGGSMTEAARAAGVDRRYLYRLRDRARK
jgi:transcriptional regulator with PAS, ATPase and Fis domain